MAFARNSLELATLKLAMASMLAMVLAPAAWGQAVDIPALVTGTRGPDTWMGAHYLHQFRTDIDSTSEKIERDSVQVVAGHRFEVSEDVFLVGNASYQGSYYDFAKSSAGSSPGSPGSPGQLRWNDVHQLTLTAGLGWKAGDNWTFVAILLGRSAGESGANFGDSLTGGGGLVIDYEWSDALSTGVVIGVLSQLEDSVALFPIPTIDWRFSDGWLFHFGITGIAYPGVGPEISYTSEKWVFGLGGSYQTRRYRLDGRSASFSSNGGPSIDKGIGEETSFPVFVRAGWNPTKNMSLSAMAGVALGGQIRSGGSGGGKIFKEDYDATPIVGLQANFRF